jgi:hypothetical protein
MDIHKLASWANVGSFVIGCAALYFVWSSQHPQVAEQGPPMQPVISLHAPMWIFLIGLVVAGLLQLTAAVIQGGTWKKKPVPSLTASSSALLPASQVEGRTIVGADITPKLLCGFFNQYMHVQAQKLVQPYIGMWMRVSGNLANVREINSSLVMVRFDAEEGASTLLFFDKEKWFNRLSILVKGNKVTVIGKIEQVDSTTFQLSECELTSG